VHFWHWFRSQTLAAWVQAFGGLLAFGAAAWAAIEASRANARAKEAERDRLSLELLREASLALADLHEPMSLQRGVSVATRGSIGDKLEAQRMQGERLAAIARLNVVAIAVQRRLVDPGLLYAALGPLWSAYGWLPRYIEGQQAARSQPHLFAPLLELLRHQPPFSAKASFGVSVTMTARPTVVTPPAPPEAPAPPSDAPGSG
jgi:hypothetical protein